MTPLPFAPSRLHPQTDVFDRFEVLDTGIPLREANLPRSAELMVFERRGQKQALLVQEMVYHHLAQGELAGEPYIVSFCGVCHSGVGLTPLVNGTLHHFKVGGLYNGVAILTDDETGTYWDHMTGRAVYGALVGQQLAIWDVEITTVAAALSQIPDLHLVRSFQRPIMRRVMHLMQGIFGKTGWLPSLFTQTMATEDTRLPRMTVGLGVVVAGNARFYPMTAIQGTVVDTLGSEQLHVTRNPIDEIPQALDQSGNRPLQYFLRWYGFALTYPECSIYDT